ncbi:DEKNAAC103064 [Brettanomyces naardenensis]|uniref:DEKNAAC103064 n=1 Tax=Brettanomyces naardenensis TaxID=13370 RepID=A0A448YMA4_BRENA|nr:DEKNAAC103064 [Brettanomyces naardenensis]
MPASRQQVLRLYRNVLRASHEFEYYNFREYFLRKARRDFRAFKGEDNTEAYNDGLKQLGILRRQSMISQMYPFDKLVVERLDERHHEIGAALDASTSHN